jgi:hypothetical protein
VPPLLGPAPQSDAPEVSRLFVVLTTPLSSAVLNAAFSQVAPLEYVRFQPGKTYGFVKVCIFPSNFFSQTNFSTLHLLLRKLQFVYFVVQPFAVRESRYRYVCFHYQPIRD